MEVVSCDVLPPCTVASAPRSQPLRAGDVRAGRVETWAGEEMFS